MNTGRTVFSQLMDFLPLYAAQKEFVRVRRLLGLRWMRFDGRLFGGSVAVGKDAVMEVAPRRQEDVSILRHRVRSEPNAKSYGKKPARMKMMQAAI